MQKNIKSYFTIPVLCKIAVLIFISILLFNRNTKKYDYPFIAGDGYEYVLTTEAFLNHGSPDVTADDIKSFKQKCIKMVGSWDKFPLNAYVDDLISRFDSTKPVYKAYIGVFFFNKSGKKYCFHFSMYSLLNVPMYAIFSKSNPVIPFYYTNSIMVIIACFFLLFFTPFSTVNSILASLCFCFSSAYWYLNWTHTEIFTMCFLLVGLIFYFRKRYLIGLLLISIGCTQNQPLILCLGFLALNALIQMKITPLNIIKIGFACIIAIFPPLFYYYNFETTNLIKDAGFLNPVYVTANRVSGVFFDLNQGMILSIPLILVCYILFTSEKIWQIFTKKQRPDFMVFMPLVLVIVATVFSSMINWNHGMAIINRYATWLSVPVILITFYLTHKKSIYVSTILFSLYFITQLSTVLYHEKFNINDWSQGANRPIAKWVFNNCSGLYSPDPMIFAGRSDPFFNFDVSNSPFIYFDNNHRIKKMLVYETRLDSLSSLGYSKNTISKIRNSISYNYGWGYVDTKYKSNFSDEAIFQIIRGKKMKAITAKINGSPDWSAQIRSKAASWGKSYEEVLQMDVEYALEQEEKEKQK